MRGKAGLLPVLHKSSTSIKMQDFKRLSMMSSLGKCDRNVKGV